MAGINTQNSLLNVIELARQQSMPIDMILATGDLVHDSSIEGYTRLRNHLEQFDIPVYCLPGNHDNPKVMSEQMDSVFVSSPKTVSIGNWLIVLLDSTVPGSASGHMNIDELNILRQSLQQYPDRHTLVCLHHHPVLIGSDWMDRMSLDNPDDFFGIINGHSKVRGILWGHIHQTFEFRL
ncbi:metallophosphoesterase [Candidatus Vondammii sp. HM_W22]|uniref:metallophosphoesterase n=1 Tax=Candidatus Vondammii sp. HM_W22 TaxID=2687299 RepID=UPI001F13EB07|nr:metallophosphoesterase [Candidatus Vondammii sp. HM_W22]